MAQGDRSRALGASTSQTKDMLRVGHTRSPKGNAPVCLPQTARLYAGRAQHCAGLRGLNAYV